VPDSGDPAGTTRTVTLRRAHVAGAFYEGAAARLEREVRELVGRAASATTGPSGGGGAFPASLAGLIVPHAGYAYSGPIAAVAYARLARERPAPARVAILGPSHFVPLLGAAVPSSDGWEIPLGAVPVDGELRAAAIAAGARVNDAAHLREHAAEVQLPFVAITCPDVPVLPVAIGDMAPEAVADIIERLAAVPGTLIVVSTDLSHYLDATRAAATDERTATAIVTRDDSRIGPDHACGAHALRGMVRWAARHAFVVRRLALATSADTAGGAERVVGYGAFAIERSAGWGSRSGSEGLGRDAAQG
jgi:MEMO1 family protein